MSFREWLFAQLCEDGFITDTDSFDDDTTADDLVCETDLDTTDIENYKTDFELLCQAQGQQPEWDLAEI